MLLVGGLLTTTLGLAAFPVATTLPAWIGLALIQGIGAAGAATVANLFVVEAHPQAEWEQRLGWLQTLYAGGQVCGLGLSWRAVLSYLGMVLAWSALSVGGTAWTARLAWPHEGEGLGLFNATSALAGVLGAGLGGWVAASWGLHAVWGVVLVGVGLGVVLTLVLCPRPQARGGDDMQALHHQPCPPDDRK